MIQVNKSYLAIALTFVGIALIASAGSRSKPGEHPSTNSEYAKTAVAIVSNDMRSGGSGVILKSTANQTLILTNKHVCQLIQVGGLVLTDNNTFPVASYQIYDRHDLCVIHVMADLGVNTHIAKTPPAVYSNLVVAGHPALLPTVMSRGHFSGSMNIELIVGFEACDGTEENDMAAMCSFYGQKPIVKPAYAQTITALIMPGSSGSGVFNESGEVAGLVFAGSGEGIGYGMIVPHAYVADFISRLDSYPVQQPDPKSKARNFFTSLFNYQDMCGMYGKTNRVCHSIKNQSLWHY